MKRNNKDHLLKSATYVLPLSTSMCSLSEKDLHESERQSGAGHLQDETARAGGILNVLG